MTLSTCRGECHRDADTGDVFCPVCGWTEECPKEETINVEWFGEEESEVNDD